MRADWSGNGWSAASADWIRPDARLSELLSSTLVIELMALSQLREAVARQFDSPKSQIIGKACLGIACLTSSPEASHAQVDAPPPAIRFRAIASKLLIGSSEHESDFPNSTKAIFWRAVYMSPHWNMPYRWTRNPNVPTGGIGSSGTGHSPCSPSSTHLSKSPSTCSWANRTAV